MCRLASLAQSGSRSHIQTFGSWDVSELHRKLKAKVTNHKHNKTASCLTVEHQKHELTSTKLQKVIW